MKTFWCVKSEIHENGTVDVFLFSKQRGKMPLPERQYNLGIEVVHNWFDSKEDAEVFFARQKALNKDEEKENRPKPIRGQLLTYEEVAQILRTSEKTVYDMATKNEIPPYRIRCSLRFDSADVDDYLFFSKFRRRDNYRITPRDVKEVSERFDDQIDHSKSYLENFLARYLAEQKKKEAGMK